MKTENDFDEIIINFKIKGDERGSLISIEQKKEIPFEIKRVYYIFDVKKNIRRGFHAHKCLQQVAICLHGSCKFLLDNGKVKSIIQLDKPLNGIFIDALIWHEMFDFSNDCVLLLLASDFYNESDYIRDYKHFMEIISV